MGKEMNRSAAIRWCFANLKSWPNNTKSFHPEGWRWIISNLPYRDEEYKLVNANFEEIRMGDIL